MEYGLKRNGKTGTKRTALIGFAVLMVGLGISDSLRGIFSTILQEHFQLDARGLSNIIMASYAGNLCFLLLGGRLMDRFDRKKAFLGILAVWMAALLLFLLTDSFWVLLAGMFLAMGASTLLNTTINLMTPLLFLTSPGFVVNFLFFTQGIGTSGGQSLIGNAAEGFGSWKLVNGILLAVGAAAFLIIMRLEIPDAGGKKAKKASMAGLMKNSTVWIMILAFGLYFIAEHGILNWFVVYGTEALGMERGAASNYLALFYGGITVGRLVFAPFIDRLGPFRSIAVFGAAGAVLYAAGILSGQAVWLMSVSGLFFSIVYPTLVMSIGKLNPPEVVSTVSGFIISAASLFDIGFNYVFGNLAGAVGYGASFLIMPASMVLFVILYFICFRKKILGRG
ncbi:MAG: MFS transporter [Clostridiales bacterium]|nr:MFS transporter [Clostridiales bacterium]